MRLKLDENLGAREQGLFRDGGHEVETVVLEGLSGAPDQAVFERCCREGWCLITLGLDFTDPVRFSSRACGGIVVLRSAGRLTAGILDLLVRQCLEERRTLHMERDLWIVEPTRIRIHQRDDDNLGATDF